MLTEEEKEAERNGWREEAAARGLLLEGIDPNDKDEMKEVFAVLKVSDITAKSRLRVFIQNVRRKFGIVVLLSCCVDVACFVCSPVTLTCLS